jgi:hypothetical protein
MTLPTIPLMIYKILICNEHLNTATNPIQALRGTMELLDLYLEASRENNFFLLYTCDVHEIFDKLNDNALDDSTISYVIIKILRDIFNDTLLDNGEVESIWSLISTNFK